MSRFRTYLENTFNLTSSESDEVMNALVKPLTKSIRINTQKISREDFMIHAREQEWTLTETNIPEVFLIDREDTTMALGRTLEHAAGWFYIQELAAAHPPFLLQQEIQNAKSKMQNDGIIIDMCASPG